MNPVTRTRCTLSGISVKWCHAISVKRVSAIGEMRSVHDDDVMRLLKLMLKASGKQGVPQGGVISPLLSNIYLTEVDRMLERAKAVTRYGRYTTGTYPSSTPKSSP